MNTVHVETCSLHIISAKKKVEQYRTKWMALASADISSTCNSYMLRYLFYKGNVSLQQSNNKQAFLMLPQHLTINN